MTTSNRNIMEAFAEFRGKIDTIKKTSKNPFFGSNYADINTVIGAINPVLDEVGLVYVQSPTVLDGFDYLKTTVYMQDNPDQSVESMVRLILTKNDMQQLGSAITYARRYALISMFGLETEDDDGNMVSGKVSKKAPKTEKKLYNTTPTQQQNARINKAFELLDNAKERGDINKAKTIYFQAESEGITQICDKAISLFGDEL